MERVTVRMARSDRSTPWGFGVTEAPDGAVVIVNIVGGSLADRAGLRNGDVIDRLEDLDNLDINAVDRLLVTAHEKIELVVTRNSSGPARIWRPEITENTGNNSRPYSVNLQHSNDSRPPQGFNNSALPFETDSRVKHMQYNSPLGLYSDKTAAEQYVQQTAGYVDNQGARATASNNGNEPAYMRSETLRLLKEQENGHNAAPTLSSHPNPSNLPICFVCSRPILGVMARAAGRDLHADCLACATCGNSLRNVGHHFIDEKFYCDIHGSIRKTDRASSVASPSRFDSPSGGARTVHYHPPKTQGLISPSHRGVPTATFGADLSKTTTYGSQSPALSPSRASARPGSGMSYGAGGAAVAAPPPPSTNPPPLNEGSRVPESVRNAVSPRRRQASREWPPKQQSSTLHRYWKLDQPVKKEKAYGEDLAALIRETDALNMKRDDAIELEVPVPAPRSVTPSYGENHIMESDIDEWRDTPDREQPAKPSDECPSRLHKPIAVVGVPSVSEQQELSGAEASEEEEEEDDDENDKNSQTFKEKENFDEEINQESENVIEKEARRDLLLDRVRQLEDDDRIKAIESIARHQSELEATQTQLSALLDTAIEYLSSLQTPPAPPQPPKRSVFPFGEPKDLQDASVVEDSRNFIASRLCEQMSKGGSQGRSTFERTTTTTTTTTTNNHGAQPQHQQYQSSQQYSQNQQNQNQHQHHQQTVGSTTVSQGSLNEQRGAGGRIPYCEACQQPIRGAFVLATGKSWCPEHFVCANSTCRRRLLECGFVEERGEKFCEGCFEQHIAPRCAKCSKPIVSDCLNALQKKWHPTCFTCAHCQKPFGNSAFYLEQGLPYCEQDWNALFTTKCVSCRYPIEAGDRWVEALGNAFHSNCFTCTRCNHNLEGESFFAKNGQPFCKLHA